MARWAYTTHALHCDCDAMTWRCVALSRATSRVKGRVTGRVKGRVKGRADFDACYLVKY